MLTSINVQEERHPTTCRVVNASRVQIVASIIADPLIVLADPAILK
jgi:hypothetical protein